MIEKNKHRISNDPIEKLSLSIARTICWLAISYKKKSIVYYRIRHLSNPGNAISFWKTKKKTHLNNPIRESILGPHVVNIDTVPLLQR